MGAFAGNLRMDFLLQVIASGDSNNVVGNVEDVHLTANARKLNKPNFRWDNLITGEGSAVIATDKTPDNENCSELLVRQMSIGWITVFQIVSYDLSTCLTNMCMPISAVELNIR